MGKIIEVNSFFYCIFAVAYKYRMKCVVWIAVLLIAHRSYAQDECDSHQECPTWFIPDTSSTNKTTCKCANSISEVVQCGKQSNQSSLRRGYCMTYNCEHNSTYVGKCPFNTQRAFKIIKLPASISNVNEFMCGGLNRTGLLCGRCMDGLGVATLSHERYCSECWNSFRGWALYVFLILFPPTLFFFVVLLFQIKVTSGEMNFFIFIAHFITVFTNQVPQYQTTGSLFYLLTTFYGFWNLDFFRYVSPHICVSDKVTQMHVIALDYIPALYPLLLIVLTYVSIELHDRDYKVFVWLWKPFGKCFTRVKILRNLNPKASVIHTFAAFLLLSYSKLLFVSFSLMNYTTVYNITGDQFGPRRVYYNATLSYLSSEHIPFFVLAIFILVIIVVPFTLLVLLYPMRWFQRCICCSGRGAHALHTFADIFHGCYKNGTNGTRDYRYFAGFYLIFRIIVMVGFMSYIRSFVIGSIVGIVVSLSFALLRPYRNNWFNLLDCCYCALLALYIQLRLYKQYVFDVPDIVLSGFALLPFLYFIVYSACKLLLYTGVFQRCRCYQRLRCLKDDAENNDYVLPHRLDDPSDYTDVPSTREKELSGPKGNRLQNAAQGVSNYGSIK